MKSLVDKLAAALQALYDVQNGPPLIRDKDEWETAMKMTEAVLEKYNELSNLWGIK